MQELSDIEEVKKKLNLSVSDAEFNESDDDIESNALSHDIFAVRGKIEPGGKKRFTSPGKRSIKILKGAAKELTTGVANPKKARNTIKLESTGFMMDSSELNKMDGLF